MHFSQSRGGSFLELSLPPSPRTLQKGMSANASGERESESESERETFRQDLSTRACPSAGP